MHDSRDHISRMKDASLVRGKGYRDGGWGEEESHIGGKRGSGGLVEKSKGGSRSELSFSFHVASMLFTTSFQPVQIFSTRLTRSHSLEMASVGFLLGSAVLYEISPSTSESCELIRPSLLPACLPTVFTTRDGLILSVDHDGSTRTRGSLRPEDSPKS